MAALSLAISGMSLGVDQPQLSLFDKMSHTEVLEMTMEVSFDSIAKNRKSVNKFEATINFVDAIGQSQSWNTEIQVRGKYRRSICADIPPLKLKFKRNDLIAAGLSTSNDLKLVTQCVEDEDRARETLMREYLVYKLYNQLTDYSYRVQLVKMTFVDRSTMVTKNQWAFLIEDTAQLRARVNAKKLGKKERFDVSQIRAKEEQTAALFQYLVGNHDWAIVGRKNIKLIREGEKIVVIPYDFDFAGIVHAPYAKANSTLGIKSRFDRVYLGNESNNEELKETVEHFFSKKKAMMETVKDFDLLSRNAKRDMVNYMNHFFKQGKDVQIVTSLLSAR